MTAAERAAQIWPVLCFAARGRQTLTYDLLAQLIGVLRPGLGQLLEPIQSYCLVKSMPPLTILVVSGETGLPGSGFTGADDIPRSRERVFDHDWLGSGCPAPSELEAAVRERPSNAVRR